MTADLHLDDREGVRTLTIDRPGSRNGLTVDLVARLAAAIADLPAGTRVVVLAGAHGAFCSGLDLKDAVNAYTRALIEASLARCGGIQRRGRVRRMRRSRGGGIARQVLETRCASFAAAAPAPRAWPRRGAGAC